MKRYEFAIQDARGTTERILATLPAHLQEHLKGRHILDNPERLQGILESTVFKDALSSYRKDVKVQANLLVLIDLVLGVKAIEQAIERFGGPAVYQKIEQSAQRIAISAGTSGKADLERIQQRFVRMREQLTEYHDQTVAGLPEELRKELYGLPLIPPLTVGGLESVEMVIRLIALAEAIIGKIVVK